MPHTRTQAHIPHTRTHNYTLVCQMHMSESLTSQRDCWRNKFRNICARAKTICCMLVEFPLPHMFNVVLHKAVAGWGQTKHVNYATPTPSRTCQHWTLGARGLNQLLVCDLFVVWHCVFLLFRFRRCCERYSVNRRLFVFIASWCTYSFEIVGRNHG